MMTVASLFSSFASMSDLSSSHSSFGLFSPFDFLFNQWPGKIFERDNWRNFLTTFAIYLSLGTAAFFIIERRARLLGNPFNPKAMKTIGIVLTVLGFITYFDFFNPNVRYNDYYHRHEFYHYYLGAKYFKELGYSRLYECTVVAEIESGRGEKLRDDDLRDLNVNLIRPIKSTYVFTNPGICKDHFSPERWTAFKTDVNWFESTARGSYWDNMKKDHGYNPPPVWTMAGKFFAQMAPAGDGFFKLLALIDIFLQIGVLALFGWAFGWRVMTVASVFWGTNAVANFYWTGGAFMRQDWIFFLVAAICFARKRYFGLSGASLTWSALLRVFPLITFFGWGVMILIHLVKHRSLHPDHKRLIAGCAVAVGVLVPASMVVCGPSSYTEFTSHIVLHKDTPLTNHMGLETMLVHSWDGRMLFTQDDRLDDPFAAWKDGRRERKDHVKWVQRGIILLVAGWIAWALRRTKLLWVGVGLSVPLTITILNLTCYYYAIFLAAIALVRVRPALAAALLATSAASQVIHYRFYFIDDKFAAHSYLFYALGLLLIYGYSRPFSVARLKAWWRGEPEPRCKPAELPPAPAPDAAS